MEVLSSIHLEATPFKEWPSSIIGPLTPAINSLFLWPSGICQMQKGNVVRFDDYSIELKEDEPDSSINGCFTGIEHLSIVGSLMDLVRLPIRIPHLQHLKSLSLFNHPDLAIDEIHSSIGYLTGLKNLHLTTSPFYDGIGPPHFNNWYLDNFSIYCSSTLQELDLSKSYIVRLPPSIESFVELRILKLEGCYHLEEILHLPPNIQELYANHCSILERFPEVSTKFQFYTSCGLQELRWINLSYCHKLDANIGSQVPNPSFVEEHIQDHSCGTIFRGNKIPDWFSHTKETSYSHYCELDIVGPLYLDKIIGIVFCAAVGKHPSGFGLVSTNIYVSINGHRLVEAIFFINGGPLSHGDRGHVYLTYSFPKSIEQWLQYPRGDNLRFIFEREPYHVFKSCGVHIIYKHEENESLTVGECSVDSSNGIQLSKRRRDDVDSNLEFNRHPQHKRLSQNLVNSNVVNDDFAEVERGYEGV